MANLLQLHKDPDTDFKVVPRTPPPPASKATLPVGPGPPDDTEDFTADELAERQRSKDAAQAMVDQVQEKKGKDFKLTDLLVPAVLGGLTAAMGSGGFGSRLKQGLTGAATFVGAKNKEANRLDQLDRQFNAAEKQRRFSRATVAIKDLASKGMFDAAATLSVEMYKKMGIETNKEDMMKKFTSDKMLADREVLWKQYERLMDREMIAAAKDLEVTRYREMNGSEATPEQLLEIEERYRGLMKLRKWDPDRIEAELKALKVHRENIKIVRDMNQLKLDKSKVGVKGTPQEVELVRRTVRNAVYATAVRELSNTDQKDLEKYVKEHPDDPFAETTFLALNSTDAKGQRVRGKMTAEMYVKGYESYLNNFPEQLTIGEGKQRRVMTIQEVFAGETDILETLEGINLRAATDRSAEDFNTSSETPETTTPTPPVNPQPPAQTGGGPPPKDPPPKVRQREFDPTKYKNAEAAKEILEAIEDLRTAAAGDWTPSRRKRAGELMKQLNELRVK